MSAETLDAIGFANTVHAVRGKLKDGLPAWLERRGHSADIASSSSSSSSASAEATGFAALRDAIRSLLDATVAGEAYPAQAVATVNAASAAAPFWLELRDGEPRVEERPVASGVQAELGAIARGAIALLTGEQRDSLRFCQAPGCVQFFVKAHPRQEFCGPACGNRARAARHYARRKED
jgi:predicted RNA-binding Zn ribbon-like protein